jgi:UTP--glucose-1-phosphate uridylyltransferase
MPQVTKAVIAAAGFGTRFLPQTKAMPKEMLPLIDKPIIQYVVEELVSVGIKDIIIVTNYSKRSIEDHFDKPSQDLVNNLLNGGESKKPLLDEVEAISDMANFVYVRQKGPIGNGTPLINAENLIGNEPFIFTWSDDFVVADTPRFQQMIDAYEKYNCSIMGAVKADRDEDYDRYGYAAGNEISHGVIDVQKIIEKPGKANAPSTLATNAGFLLTPDIFEYLHRAKKELPENEELVTNDVLMSMVADGRQVVAINIENGHYYDAGNKLEYLKTIVDFALQRPDMRDEFLAYLREKVV